MIRTFPTGATRNLDADKLDFEGFLSPLVIEAFGVYMNHHRHLVDGSLRDSDNWQRGIPADAYMKSAWRHFLDWWRFHRKLSVKENAVWALCGVIFNVQGYLHELLKSDPDLLQRSRDEMEARREAAPS